MQDLSNATLSGGPPALVLLLGIAIGLLLALLGLALVAPSYIRRARNAAVAQSRAVTRGQIYEQLVPYLPEFTFNPKDAQFLGKPVDFVVFDGLDEGDVQRIVFVEVKTGRATLTTRERRIREAVRQGRVEWRELRVGADHSPRGKDTAKRAGTALSS